MSQRKSVKGIYDGNNIDFSIITSKNGNKSDDISGNFINFNLVKPKKESTKSLISGSTVDFTIKSIGNWSLTEKKSEICMICKLPLKSDQEIKQCPMCNSLFHQNHIIDWLRVKGKCPVCQQTLGPAGLESIKL